MDSCEGATKEHQKIEQFGVGVIQRNYGSERMQNVICSSIEANRQHNLHREIKNNESRNSLRCAMPKDANLTNSIVQETVAAAHLQETARVLPLWQLCTKFLNLHVQLLQLEAFAQIPVQRSSSSLFAHDIQPPARRRGLKACRPAKQPAKAPPLWEDSPALKAAPCNPGLRERPPFCE